MTSRRRLDDAEIEDALRGLEGWDLRDGKLHRVLQFADFAGAFAFMTAIAQVAEAMDHHPEWLNVWNRVEIWLSTHDALGITRLDVDLARAIDARTTS